MIGLTKMIDLFHDKSANDNIAIDDLGKVPFNTRSIPLLTGHFSSRYSVGFARVVL